MRSDDLCAKEIEFIKRGCWVKEVTGRQTEIEPRHIVVVELEPTHYKSDLWNIVSGSDHIDLFVIHTQTKNWAPDGGHNYLRFPRQYYSGVVLAGRGMLGALRSAIYVANNILMRRPDVVFVCGYSHIQANFAIFTAFILGKPFIIYVDEFNNKRPPGNFSFVKWLVRETLRKFSFSYAKAVFVCGKKGANSAIRAGCAQNKIYDFPYVVNLERLLTDVPEDIPGQCLADVRGTATVLFFSGRMIERKGLPSLFRALSEEDVGGSWTLWIEGAGPELESYIALAHEYGFQDRCRFLGFCQYDLHSWLIRSADVIIVPSLEDNWGIVVDEGLQLGKVVISSDATGSGYDRITDKVNGYIFPAGDSRALATVLRPLLNGGARNSEIEKAARESRRNIRPVDNLNTLIEVLRCG